MSLTEYRRKRQFGKTREPEPGQPLPQGQRAIFVVQLHHASRRHYDFRLQVGDALKSWAVPKGPSFDPSVKRMAAEVEDHPVDYASFEGEIPKGEYGGGHVALFDRGTWSTPWDAEAQLAKGHLRFELYGEKLKGGWHLVRSGGDPRKPQWLLFKEKDDYASTLEADDLLADVQPPPAEDAKRSSGKPTRKPTLTAPPAPKAARKRWDTQAAKLTGAKKAPLAEEPFEPQLAKLGQAPPAGEQWLHELKWDGYRILATVHGGKARLWSRNALEWTSKLPDIAASVERLGLKQAALDGEVIAQAGAQADFGVLQATLSGEKHAPLAYVLFDLLHVDGYAIDRAPLLERKQLLERILSTPVPHLAYSSHIPGDGRAAFELAAQREFEGIISKRADLPYHPGRGDDWRKTKHLDSDEFAVVGYTAPKGRRSGFGSLLLARPDPDHGWVYAGRVGSGFSEALIEEVTARIGDAGQRTPTVHVADTDTDLRSAKWFAPRFVVEVYIRGAGNQGLLRQPSLKAVRLDKRVEDLADSDRAGGAARAAAAATRAAVAKGAQKATKKRGKAAAAPEVDPGSDAIAISSPTKVIYADRGATKRDVADYYLSVMDHLLPEIANRPLSIIRCPNGADKPCFFQKHHTPGLERVDLVRLKEEAGNQANYLVVRDAGGLMELVQFNALEFHPWGSHADAPDRADRVVFDLDPAEDVPWTEVKAAARLVRELLEQLGLASFLRTSGGKGLHVVVPLNPGCDWSVVKPFARSFAETLSQMQPDRFLSVATKRLRNGRIFIDYLRNGRGATSVASYSLRARPGAPVAVPLRWNELSALKRSDAFDIETAPKRLARLRSDPWEGIDDVKQDLDRVSELLGKPR